MVRYRNIVVWALLLAFLPVITTAQNTDYFNQIGFKVIKSDGSELVLSYRPVIQHLDTIITQNGTMTILPVISGASLIEGKAGMPSLLSVSIPVAVPDKDKFTLSDVSVKNIMKIPSRISPLPGFQLIHNVHTEIYRINEQEYSLQNTSPYVNLNYGGVSRDIHIATLELTVARFNSRLQSIEIPQEVIIKIKFADNLSRNENETNTANAGFGNTVINANISSAWRVGLSTDNALSKKSFERIQELSSGNWIKLTIENEGIYKIDAADLASLGFNIKKKDVNTIKIFGNGGIELSEKVSASKKNIMNEQAIIVKTNSNGDLQSIIFYGAPTEGFRYERKSFRNWYNHYSNKNYYMLTWGGSEGKRIKATNAHGTVKNKPLSYIERILHREELACALVGGSGRVWFGGSLFPRAFSNVLNNLDRTKEIFFRFNFAHRSDSNGQVTISESGKKINQVYLPETDGDKYLDAHARTGEVSVSASAIPGDNRSLLNFTYTNPKIAGSLPFFNWYEIHYSRSFVPVDNQIGFWSAPTMTGITEFSINGFSSDIIGFEITNPANPKFIENESVTGGMFVFKYKLDTIPSHFFISSKLLKPKLSLASFANLREKDGDAEMLLITHQNFMSSAEKYKKYRAARKIEIVNIKDVFNEFNAGLPDPTALRDYIAFVMAHRSIKPKYVLLWGDGHYDYKNIQTKVPNYIITYQSIEDNLEFYSTKSYTSDDYFAFVVGNDELTDVSISRIPINSDEEGEWMVEKIKTYENNYSLDNWATHLLLLADDSPTSHGYGDGATHTTQSETLASKIIPPYMYNKKIYLPEYPSENIPNGRRKPAVTEDMVAYINNYGSLTVNWIGHGNPRVWSHEEFFNRDKTISQFKNLNKLFFNTAATCDFARWDMPEGLSGAEALFLAKNGGSIGEFSATRVVYSLDNAYINQVFYTQLFTRDAVTKQYRPLGDVMFSVKQIRTKLNDKKYNLLADPLLKLLIPHYIVRVVKINEKSVVNPKDTAQIKAKSKVRIEASVINPIDSSIVSDFNGTAFVSLLDADYSNSVEDVDGTRHTKQNYGGVLNRGRFNVINGTIKAEFYTPEDISFTNGPGRLYIYALANDKRRANGINRQFVVAGVSSVAFNAQKPTIGIYLDSTSFRAGDIVSSKPMLIIHIRDKYGVNTSGSGIGHRLEAWIDNNPYPIDLTDNTYISPDDPKVVIAKKLLSNLSPGRHTLKVRAWNVFNKYSIADTYFRILSGDEGAMLWNVGGYPNPFRDKVTLRFRHNLSLPFDATLSIFNANGRAVNTINSHISSVHTSEIRWDGTDFEGKKVAQGTYIINLEINTDKGKAKASAGVTLLR